MTLTVLITGATAGFGAAIAERLVADGHRVIATGRRAERLEAFAEEAGGRKAGKVLPFALDVTDAAAVAALPGSLPEGWREVDVLVNNAGLALGLEPAHKADVTQWDKMIATNITGLVHMTRALLPGMVERDRGHVVNLGSIAGSYPYPGGHIYGGTKAFVKQFTLNLKADLIGTFVRVTDVEPGLCGRHRVLGGPFRRRQGPRRQALRGCRVDPSRGHRRDGVLGHRPAAPRQHQPHRDHADLPGAGAATGEASGVRRVGQPRHRVISCLLLRSTRRRRMHAMILALVLQANAGAPAAGSLGIGIDVLPRRSPSPPLARTMRRSCGSPAATRALAAGTSAAVST